MINATLEYSKDENPIVKTFFFRPHKPVSYVAGQFTEVYIPHQNPDNRGQKRWFTLSSAPHEDLLSITTKVTSQPSSFKRALLALKPGDTLRIAEPMGDFILPKDTSLDIIFVAGGIGITPIRSMISDTLTSHAKRTIHVIYATNHQAEFAFINELKQGAKKLDLITLQHDATWTELSGTLSADRILLLHPPQEHSLYYIAGPEPMVETITKDMLSKDVPKQQIVTDYFPGYTQL